MLAKSEIEYHDNNTGSCKISSWMRKLFHGEMIRNTVVAVAVPRRRSSHFLCLPEHLLEYILCIHIHCIALMFPSACQHAYFFSHLPDTTSTYTCLNYHTGTSFLRLSTRSAIQFPAVANQTKCHIVYLSPPVSTESTTSPPPLLNSHLPASPCP